MGEWLTLSAAILDVGRGTSGANEAQASGTARSRANLKPLATKIGAVLDGNGMRWDERVSNAWRAGRPSRAAGDEGCVSRDLDVLRHNALRIGWAVIARDPALIPTPDRRRVLGILGREGAMRPLADLVASEPPPFPSPPAPIDSTTVGFRFCRPASRRSRSLVDGHALALVDVVDPADAPAVLALTSKDGHTFEVRRQGVVWFRPILEPGSWRPIGIDRFVQATASGEAWFDNPFLPRPAGPRESPLHMDDAVTPGLRASCASDELDERAKSRALGRAGRLALIDGIVHRVVDAPRYVATVGSTGHSTSTGVAWCFADGLNALSAQDHFVPIADGGAAPESASAASLPYSASSRIPSLPAWESEAARTLVETLASLDPAADNGWVREWALPCDLGCEVLDPEGLGSGLGGVLDWLGGFRDRYTADMVPPSLDPISSDMAAQLRRDGTPSPSKLRDWGLGASQVLGHTAMARRHAVVAGLVATLGMAAHMAERDLDLSLRADPVDEELCSFSP